MSNMLTVGKFAGLLLVSFVAWVALVLGIASLVAKKEQARLQSEADAGLEASKRVPTPDDKPILDAGTRHATGFPLPDGTSYGYSDGEVAPNQQIRIEAIYQGGALCDECLITPYEEGEILVVQVTVPAASHEVKLGTLSEFQGILRKDFAAMEFTIPFTEMPRCNAKGTPGEEPTISYDQTHIWLTSDKWDDVEVYCIGVRGTDS